MSFLMPIQWYHSQADQIWPDGTFKGTQVWEFLAPILNFVYFIVSYAKILY